MSLVEVDYDTYTEVTRLGTGKFDGDDTESTHEINGLKLVGERDFRDILTTFDVEQDKEYLLLYAQYSTGDSFCFAYNACIEFIDLFTVDQIDVVKENISRIAEHEKKYRVPGRKNLDYTNAYSVDLIHHDGLEYKFGTPWMTHFEELVTVDYKRVQVIDVYPD